MLTWKEVKHHFLSSKTHLLRKIKYGKTFKAKMLLVIITLCILFPQNAMACNRMLTHNRQLLEDLFEKPVMRGRTTTREIEEISGIAASRRHTDIIYALNDSGHKAKIYAINTTNAQLVGTYTIQNGLNCDWEDIAVGPGPYGQYYIYIGDIGGNSRSRCDMIYRIREPLSIETEGSLSIHGVLRYEWDEPNSETMMVDEKGNLFIIAKIEPNGEKPKIYEIPSFNLRYRKQALKNGTSVNINLETYGPTGGDISISGRQVLLRTYSYIYYWYRDPSTSIPETLARPPLTLPQTHVEPQGEAICWDNKEQGFYTISEGPYQPLYYYRTLDISNLK